MADEELSPSKKRGARKERFTLRRFCIVLDVLLIVWFIDQGIIFSQRTEMQKGGAATPYLLMNLAVALLLACGAILLARRSRWGNFVQAAIFILMGAIVVATLTFEP